MKKDVTGSLLGCAVGDVLAATALTAHTQLAVCTADGLIRGWVRYRLKGLGPVFQSTVRSAYERWVSLQGWEPARSPAFGVTGWIWDCGDLWCKVAPDEALMHSVCGIRPGAAPSGAPDHGSVLTRAIPAGLFAAQFQEDANMIRRAFDLGAEIARIGETSPRTQAKAGAVAAIIACLATQESIVELGAAAGVGAVAPIPVRESGIAAAVGRVAAEWTAGATWNFRDI